MAQAVSVTDELEVGLRAGAGEDGRRSRHLQVDSAATRTQPASELGPGPLMPLALALGHGPEQQRRAWLRTAHSEHWELRVLGTHGLGQAEALRQAPLAHTLPWPGGPGAVTLRQPPSRTRAPTRASESRDPQATVPAQTQETAFMTQI
eukprot:2841773-Rhodomonas_salina.3